MGVVQALHVGETRACMAQACMGERPVGAGLVFVSLGCSRPVKKWAEVGPRFGPKEKGLMGLGLRPNKKNANEIKIKTKIKYSKIKAKVE